LGWGIHSRRRLCRLDLATDIFNFGGVGALSASSITSGGVERRASNPAAELAQPVRTYSLSEAPISHRAAVKTLVANPS
jgi:hypothetical protein